MDSINSKRVPEQPPPTRLVTRLVYDHSLRLAARIFERVLAEYLVYDHVSFGIRRLRAKRRKGSEARPVFDWRTWTTCFRDRIERMRRFIYIYIDNVMQIKMKQIRTWILEFQS